MTLLERYKKINKVEREYIKLLNEAKDDIKMKNNEVILIKDIDKKVINDEYIKLLSDENKMIDLANYEEFSIIEKEIINKYNILLRVIPREYVELFKDFDEQVSWLRALESNFTFEEGFKMGMKFFNK